MANEIIRGETARESGKTTFYFYIPIQLADRVAIGNSSTQVVPDPTSSIDARILVVLDGAKQTALDAGDALIVTRSLAVTDNVNVRAVYARWVTRAIDRYKDQYKNFGKEINES